MSKLEVSARMKVREGKLEGFKNQAAECIRRTKEKHTRILRYDWFLSKDETECEVSEVYPDPAALIEHHANLGDATATLYARFADGHRVTLYGEPPPELVERAKAGQTGKFNWYCFLQGLEPEPGSSRSQTSGPGEADIRGRCPHGGAPWATRVHIVQQPMQRWLAGTLASTQAQTTPPSATNVVAPAG